MGLCKRGRSFGRFDGTNSLRVKGNSVTTLPIVCIQTSFQRGPLQGSVSVQPDIKLTADIIKVKIINDV
jgi:hypothetical protein